MEHIGHTWASFSSSASSSFSPSFHLRSLAFDLGVKFSSALTTAKICLTGDAGRALSVESVRCCDAVGKPCDEALARTGDGRAFWLRCGLSVTAR